MRYDKSKVVLQVLFVPEADIEMRPVVIGRFEGAEAASKAALNYLDGQWTDNDRLPEHYGPVWKESHDLITDFATNDQHGVVACVEFGSLVIC